MRFFVLEYTYQIPLEDKMSEKYIEERVEEVSEITLDQDFIDEQAKKKKRLEIWDKVTTGLFIALLASPVIILLYIFLWFVSVS